MTLEKENHYNGCYNDCKNTHYNESTCNYCHRMNCPFYGIDNSKCEMMI